MKNILILLLCTTSFSFSDLLSKCINNHNDINNNGKVTPFEKKTCDKARYIKKLDEDNKKLDEDNKKLDEDNKKLDEDNKKLDEDIKKIRKIKKLLSGK